mgnify:CR=1 FL=1
MGFKQKLLNKNYSVLVLLIFLISLFQKSRLITFVEYKYDQAFASNVLRSCSITKILNLDFDFLFIKSSVGIPQGPFHYTLECLSGIIGINNYIEFLRFKIIFLQILIFAIFYIIKNSFSAKQSVSFLILILFNPYLIISSRNISSVYNYEFILLFFMFFYIKLNKNKKYSFAYGLISTLIFAFYFPLFIFASTLNIVLLLIGNVRFKIEFFLGSLTGLFMCFISYWPFLSGNNFVNLANTNESWGLTSYWRINLNALAGDSLRSKINSPYDIETLQLIFPNYLIFYNLNKVIITFLIIYSLYGLLTKIKTKKIDKLDIVFLICITFTGIIFTLIDIALYPHYFFFNVFFSVVFITKNAKDQNILLIVSILFFISSNIVINNFHRYIEVNKGANNSDYGASYNTCGCCVENAKLCRGQ